MELKLPLGITINKGSWKGRVTYIVRSESLGELESIFVRGIDDTSTAPHRTGLLCSWRNE